MKFKIQLITKCGCTKMVDQVFDAPPHRTHRTYRVPLVTMTVFNIEITPSPSFVTDAREFEYKGKTVTNDDYDVCVFIYEEI